MNKIFLMSACIITLFIFGCSKKTIPEKPKEPVQSQQSGQPIPSEGPGTAVVPPKPKPVEIRKTPAPKMISVNDAVAKKAVDGRLYYDLEGKRYWRNKKDGKYYQYYRGMHEDPNFKP